MSSGLVPVSEHQHFEELNQVIGLMLEGYAEKDISAQLSIPQTRVKSYVAEFKTSAVHAQAVNDRAYELLASMDAHYSKLIRKAYEVVEDIDAVSKEEGVKASTIAQKTVAIKAIADLEKQRLEAFNKAGMLEGIDLGNQIADNEEKVQQTLELLEEVVKEYPQTRDMIKAGIARISGRASEVVIIPNEQ